MSLYFWHFLISAKHRPRRQGIWVTPLGRLPLLVRRPCDSRFANVTELINTWHVKSFSWSWREWRPDPWRHERPWFPSAATVAPQTQTCGRTTGVPRRRPVCWDEDRRYSYFKPTEDDGSAWSQSQYNCYHNYYYWYFIPKALEIVKTGNKITN